MVITDEFKDALSYALKLHKDQVRKSSGVPYFSHLMAVAAIVIDYGGNENEAVAALLHDAIEDQGGEATRKMIYECLGETVGKIVDDCTDTDKTPKPPWKERKAAYIEHAKTINDSARIVAAADKLHNIRATIEDFRQQGDIVFERFKGGKEGTLWYYKELTKALMLGATPRTLPLVKELERSVAILELLANQEAAIKAILNDRA